ncbi:hypothetical protein BC937DRAFT_88152 [Endogone sp. FLAS-F59071]|nr:hypothetical protein BC937DRAFT_88152 [Endogone sp. FLAS-F59071]|eukprot:RUS18938.1 hypothetical protein BC937DRAFT_88152 [Endogone sp. FLAS-F59071]
MQIMNVPSDIAYCNIQEQMSSDQQCPGSKDQNVGDEASLQKRVACLEEYVKILAAQLTNQASQNTSRDIGVSSCYQGYESKALIEMAAAKTIECEVLKSAVTTQTDAIVTKDSKIMELEKAIVAQDDENQRLRKLLEEKTAEAKAAQDTADDLRQAAARTVELEKIAAEREEEINRLEDLVVVGINRANNAREQADDVEEVAVIKDEMIAELEKAVAELEVENKRLADLSAEKTAEAEAARSKVEDLSKAIRWGIAEDNEELLWEDDSTVDQADRLRRYVQSLRDKVHKLEDSLNSEGEQSLTTQIKQLDEVLHLEKVIDELTKKLNDTELSNFSKNFKIKQLQKDVAQRDDRIDEMDKMLCNYQTDGDELRKEVQSLKAKIMALESGDAGAAFSAFADWPGLLTGVKSAKKAQLRAKQRQHRTSPLPETHMRGAP